MQCYICKILGADFDPISSRIKNVRCPRCGEYKLTESAELSLSRLDVDPDLLSAALRHNSDRGTIAELDIIDGKGTETDIVRSYPIPRDPLEMVDRLLEGLSAMQGVTAINRRLILEEHISLVAGKTKGDIMAVIKLAEEMGYIRNSPGGGAYQSINIFPPGWKRLRELKTVKPSGDKAFIAMQFNDEMKGIYDRVFEPVLRSYGYQVAPTIYPVHNGKIDDFIIAEIRKSSLMIADFTGQRQNVYFEAGFATGLNIEVIKTIQSTSDESHFDTRQYNHIVWENEDDLRTKLSNRIGALPVRPSELNR